MYHERLIVGVDPVRAGWVSVVTPDGEEADEELLLRNANIAEIHGSAGIGFKPQAIKRTYLHTLAIPTVEEVDNWVRNAAARLDIAVVQGPLVISVHGVGEVIAPLDAEDALAKECDAPLRAARGKGAGAGSKRGSAIVSTAVNVGGSRAAGIPLGARTSGGTARGAAAARDDADDDPNSLGARARTPGPGGFASDIDEAANSALFTRPPRSGVFWVLDEPAVCGEIGDRMSLSAGACVGPSGTRAIGMIDGEEVVLKRLVEGTSVGDYAAARRNLLSLDRRLIEPYISAPLKTMPQLLQEMEIDSKKGPGPLEGPATAATFIDHAARTGIQTFVARHHRFKAECGARPNLPALYEHEVISTVLDYAIMYDRMNIKNLISFELLLRCIQLQESAISENPEAPTYEGARHFMGTGERRAGAYIAPDLQKFVADELGKEAAILKEKRKAREAKGRGNGLAPQKGAGQK